MAHRHGHPLAMAPPPLPTAGSGYAPVQPTNSRFLVGSPSSGAGSPGHAGHAASYVQARPSSRAARANATGLHHTGAGLAPASITQPRESSSSAGSYSHPHPRAGGGPSPPGPSAIGYPYAASVWAPVSATCATSLSDAAQAQAQAIVSLARDKFKEGWASAVTFPQTQTQTQVLVPAAPGRVQVPGPPQVQVPVRTRIPAQVRVPTPAYTATFITSQLQASTSAHTLDINSNFHSTNPDIRGNFTMAIAPASHRPASTAPGVSRRAVRTSTAQSIPPVPIPASGNVMAASILPGSFPEVPMTSSLVPAMLPLPTRRESIDSTSSTEYLSPTPVSALNPADDEERDRERPRAERKHGCWMCHKAFDRPSTLVKHLLVHTGEKAYQCETCGRRFGVQSNLNRHAKRCKSRAKAGEEGAQAADSGEGEGEAVVGEAAETAEAAAASSSATGLPTTSLTGSDASNTNNAAGAPSAPAPAPSPPLPPPATAATRGRKRRVANTNPTSPETPDASPRASASAPAALSPSTTSASSSATATTSTAPRPKRRRRAPSPHRWIPDSLRPFDLTPHTKSTPVPLPPVQPGTWEERDSFEEDVSPTPYHPCGWRGRLPGPGLMERPVDEMGRGILVLSC